MARRFLLLLLVLSVSLPVGAQRRGDLEEWQERMLRALDENSSEASNSDGLANDSRSSSQRNREGYAPRQQRDAERASAANQAERRHGGKALAVRKVGDRYRVRLLLPDGRVTTVDVNP